MTTDTGTSSISDSSKANAGRIYDYLLGGDHNFEIDRQAAQHLLSFMPLMPKIARLVRWFLSESVVRLAKEGFTEFLDFASGLPTVDHVHQVAPKGTKVIYSDIDPVTVSYGQEIIKDNPSVRYVHCDATKPETLLTSGVIEELFGANRKVAIGFNGVAYFLPNEAIAKTMKALYEWAGKGSKLFITTEDTISKLGEGDPRIKAFTDMYTRIGQPYYSRDLPTITKLLSPWKLMDPGFRPIEEWIDIKKMVSDEVTKEWGGGLYGGYLVK
jgi:hypothetical protein